MYVLLENVLSTPFKNEKGIHEGLSHALSIYIRYENISKFTANQVFITSLSAIGVWKKITHCCTKIIEVAQYVLCTRF